MMCSRPCGTVANWVYQQGGGGRARPTAGEGEAICEVCRPAVPSMPINPVDASSLQSGMQALRLHGELREHSRRSHHRFPVHANLPGTLNRESFLGSPNRAERGLPAPSDSPMGLRGERRVTGRLAACAN